MQLFNPQGQLLQPPVNMPNINRLSPIGQPGADLLGGLKV
jgi:hypothetical protein